MNKEMKVERTLILLKPDTVQRDLLGEIISRYTRKGLKVVGLKMIRISDALAESHYAHHVDKPFFKELKDFMQSAPVVGIVLEGINAVKAARFITGATHGLEADAGTIRGDFSMSQQLNLVHASDPEEDPEAEIKRFFKEEELFNYAKPIINAIYSDEEIKDSEGDIK